MNLQWTALLKSTTFKVYIKAFHWPCYNHVLFYLHHLCSTNQGDPRGSAQQRESTWYLKMWKQKNKKQPTNTHHEALRYLHILISNYKPYWLNKYFNSYNQVAQKDITCYTYIWSNTKNFFSNLPMLAATRWNSWRRSSWRSMSTFRRGVKSWTKT